MMEVPQKPLDSDCCNSGCNPCIFDVYEQELRKYQSGIKNEQQTPQEFINCISPISYTKFNLSARTQEGQNAFLYQFTLVGDSKYGLRYNVGQHFLLKAKDQQGEFTRAYTPIEQCGTTFTVLIKLYKDGRMSKYLEQLELGATTIWRGPYGDFSVKSHYQYLLFAVQGTGIAPAFSIIQQLLQKEDCDIFIKLFYCCRSCQDIYLRKQIYKMQSYWNFTYEVFLSDTSQLERKYQETVHESKLHSSSISNFLTNTRGQVQVLICGNNKFCDAIKGYLNKIPVENEDIYVF